MKKVLNFLLLWFIGYLISTILIIPNSEVYKTAYNNVDPAAVNEALEQFSDSEHYRDGVIKGMTLFEIKNYIITVLIIQTIIVICIFALFNFLMKKKVGNTIFGNPIDVIKNIFSNLVLFVFGVFTNRTSSQLSLYFDLPVRSKLIGIFTYLIIFLTISISFTLPKEFQTIQFRLLGMLQYLIILVLLLLVFFVKGFRKNYKRKLFWITLSTLILSTIISAQYGYNLGNSGLEDVPSTTIFNEMFNSKTMLMIVLMVSAFSFYIEVMKQVTQQKANIDAEMNVAKRIQDDLLPIINIKNEYFSIYGQTESANEVGGDYCDFVQLDNKQYVVAVGDVSGHNVAAGLMMSMLKVSFRTELKYLKSSKQLAQSINQTVFEHKNKNMFISFLFTLLDPKKQTMTLMNCGHLPLLYYSAKHQFIEQYRTGDIALGLQESGQFKEQQIKYSKDDVLVFVSDGLIESTNKEGEEFNLDHVCDFIKKYAKETPEKIYQQISVAEKEFRCKSNQQDDITIVVMKMA